jgi:hypothetical protein
LLDAAEPRCRSDRRAEKLRHVCGVPCVDIVAAAVDRDPLAGILGLLRHRHHVAVEIGDDPDRACDDQKHDQHAKGESKNIVRAVGTAAQM